MKPLQYEQKHKEMFMANLNDKNKIDSYEVTLRPILEEMIQNETFCEIKRKYQGQLNEETFHMLHHIKEHGIDAESHDSSFSHADHSMADTEFKEAIQHSICRVEMEYIAYEHCQKNRVLVVKTIEEMRRNDANLINVIQTLRIFHECNTILQKFNNQSSKEFSSQ